MEHFGVLHHPFIPSSVPLADEIADYLRQKGYRVDRRSSWEAKALREIIDQLDMLVVLGGDGTMLRAGRIAAGFGVPIIGVNLGRLGFLAELFPDQWRESMDKVLAGEFWREERLMLEARLIRNGGQVVGHYDALNDVVISRGSLARLVRVDAAVDGGHLTTYKADGVIVSTPTGSTGYALAVGGPILPPELKNILLIAIAPHLSLDRGVVLSEGTVVVLRVDTDHQAILTVDGQFEVEMFNGDRLEVKSSPHIAVFAHTRDRNYFYRTLMDRLRWSV